MDSLNQLVDIRARLQEIYNDLENLRSTIPSDIQNGIDKACEIIPNLDLAIAYQQDQIIHRDRNNMLSLRNTELKIESIKVNKKSLALKN